MKKIIVILLSIVTISCQKESDILNIDTNESKAYLKFDSMEDVFKTMYSLDNNNLKELKQYAGNLGVKSFYEKSNEIYCMLRNMNFESQEEVFNAFQKYQKYVEIISENGEYEAEAKLNNLLYKYLINEDQIIQVGDSLLKVFDHSIAKADLNNYKALSKFNSDVINDLNEDSNINVRRNDNLVQLMDLTHTTSTGCTDRSEELLKNNRRVKVQLLIYLSEGFYCNRYFRIAPQRQILGIWYNYPALVTGYINWRYDYKGQVGDWLSTGEKIFFNMEDDVIDGEETCITAPSGFHFKAWKCYITTDDITNYADTIFNGNLLESIDRTVYYTN